jgi:hypothetical protein
MDKTEYRVAFERVRCSDGDLTSLSIRRVYRDESGKINAIDKPMGITAGTIEELAEQLRQYQAALEQPPIDYYTGEELSDDGY